MGPGDLHQKQNDNMTNLWHIHALHADLAIPYIN